MIGIYLARAKVGTLLGASPEANAGVIRYLPLFLALLLKLTGVWLATPIAQAVTFVIAWAAKRRVDAKN